MASKFNVTQTWMEHSGGTKFYQVFKFSRIGNGTAAKLAYLNHWGPANIAAGKFARPVNGGQTQIKVGAVENPVTAKQKRGYNVIDTASREVKAHDKWFVETFGATVAENLHLSLFGFGISAEGPPSDDADNEEIETTPATKVPDVRPESWGSW